MGVVAGVGSGSMTCLSHWIMGRGQRKMLSRALEALVAESLGDTHGIPSMTGKASGLGVTQMWVPILAPFPELFI